MMKNNPSLVAAVLGETAGTVAANNVASYKKGGTVKPLKNYLLPKTKKHPKKYKGVKSYAEGGPVSADEEDEAPVTVGEDEGSSKPISSGKAPWEEDYGTPSQSKGGKEIPPWGEEKESSVHGTVLREAAQSVGPGMAALQGAGLGMEAGAPFGPVGAVVGGVGGALVGGGAARAAQDWILQKLGIVDPEQEQADEEQHPYMKLAGSLAGGGVGFNPAGVMTKAARAVGGVAMGGLEAGQEAIQGEFDPAKIAMAGGAGMLMGPTNRLGQRFENAGRAMGSQVAKRIPGRPDVAPSAPEATLESANPAGTGWSPDFQGGWDPESREEFKGPEPKAIGMMGDVDNSEDTSYSGLPQKPVDGSQTNNSKGLYDIFSPQEDPLGGSQTNSEDNFYNPQGIHGEGELAPWEHEYGGDSSDVGNASDTGASLDTVDTVDQGTGPVQRPAPVEQATVKTPESIIEDKADAAISEPTKQSLGNAQAQPPPPRDITSIGNDVNPPGRSLREYPKEDVTGSTKPVMTSGQISPDVQAAADALNANNARSKPTPTQGSGSGNGRQINTGIAEAASGRPLPQEQARAPMQPAPVAKPPMPVQARPVAPRPEVRAPKVRAPEVAKPITTKPDATVQRAIDMARKNNMEGLAVALEKPENHGKAAQAIEHMKEVAAEQKRSANRPTVEGIENAPKGKDEADVRRKSKEIKAAEDAFKRHVPENLDKIPTSKEERDAFKQRLRAAVEDYDANTDHPDLVGARDAIKQAHPDWTDEQIEKQVAKNNSKYRPRERTAAQLWLDDARKISSLKTLPTVKRISEFISNEKQLRSGNAEDVKNVRQTGRIEGDIAMNKRSGEAAMAGGEAHAAERGEWPGEHITPEDAEKWSNPEPVTNDQIKSWDEHHTLAKNLMAGDHEAMLEAAKSTEIQREIDNGPKVKVERGGKQQWEVDADKAASKAKALREARLARDAALKGTKPEITKPVNPADPPKGLKDIGKEFLTNESGSVIPANLEKSFNELKVNLPKVSKVLSSNPFTDWWHKNLTPERVGEMGTKTRDNGLLAEAAFREYNVRKSQGDSHFISALDANHMAFESRKNAKGEKLNERQWKDRNVEFIRNMEYGTKQDEPWMEAAAKHFRALLDWAHKMEAKWGSPADYIQNYFPHMWKDINKANEWIQRQTQQFGPTWFEKQRTIDLIEQGLAHGLELKSYNPAEIVTRRMMASISMQSKMWLLNAMKEMGLAHKLAEAPTEVRSNKSDWNRVNASDQNQWALSPDIQPLWRNVIEGDSLWQQEGALGSAFRGWMKAKNTWVPLKLALSAFHVLHVAHIHMNQTAIQGWASGGMKGYVKGLGEGLSDIMFPLNSKLGREEFMGTKGLFSKAMFDPNATQLDKDINQRMLEGGFHDGMPEHFKIKATRAFNEAWNSGRKTSIALNAIPYAMERLPVVSQMQKFMFEDWIPALKRQSYLKASAAALQRDPTLNTDVASRRAVFGAIAKQMDERYGEMFYNNLMWNKTIREVGVGADLSLGWNLGLINTTGGAATDAIRTAGASTGFLPKRSPVEQKVSDARNKAAYVGSYAATAMLAAGTLGMALSGKAPDSIIDLVFPRSGGDNPDGSPRRLSTMFYTREPFQVIHHIQEQNSYIGGLAQTLWNKMILAPVVSQYQNRDYFGYQVSDPNAPVYKQIYQRAKSLASDLLMPISYAGAEKAQQTGGGLRDKALSYAGFGPAPGYIAKSALQNRISHMFYEGPGAATKPYENRERDQIRRDARADRAMAMQKGDTKGVQDATQRLVKTGMKGDQIAKEKYGNADAYQYSRLDGSDQKALLRDMDNNDFKKYVLGASPVRGGARVKLIQEWIKMGNKMPN